MFSADAQEASEWMRYGSVVAYLLSLSGRF